MVSLTARKSKGMEAAPKPLRTAASALVMVSVEKKERRWKGVRNHRRKYKDKTSVRLVWSVRVE